MRRREEGHSRGVRLQHNNVVSTGWWGRVFMEDSWGPQTRDREAREGGIYSLYMPYFKVGTTFLPTVFLSFLAHALKDKSEKAGFQEEQRGFSATEVSVAIPKTKVFISPNCIQHSNITTIL